jgi:hypothetical protein
LSSLGLVLAAHEDTWTTDTWRHPSTADARYLMLLMANGYSPSEVEQLVRDAPITNEAQHSEVSGDNPDGSDADE